MDVQLQGMKFIFALHLFFLPDVRFGSEMKDAMLF
jgi:hypothetical protein